jgi:hypothetical protein
MSAITACLIASFLLVGVSIACFVKAFHVSFQNEIRWILAGLALAVLAAFVLIAGPSVLLGANLVLPLAGASFAVVFCLGLGALRSA